MKKVCCLLGPPGSGKGTNSISFLELNPEIKTVRFSIGEELRNMQGGYASAKLAPISQINSIIEEKLSQEENSYIIDGYPREMEQIKVLIKMPIKIIMLELKIEDRDFLYNRLSNRKTCVKCGRTSEDINFCFICNEPMQIRNDDMDKTKILERIHTYYLNLDGIKVFAKKNNIPIFEVEGHKTSTYDRISQIFLNFFYPLT